MSKGAKRHVRSNLQGIGEAMHEEVNYKAQCAERKLKSWPLVDRLLNTQRGRKPGPWRLLEIFTWTCATGVAAFSRGRGV